MCPRGIATNQSTNNQTTLTTKIWLLLVGVNQYQDPQLPSLRYSAVDCQGLAAALTTATNQHYSQIEVQIYHDFTSQLPLLNNVRFGLQEIAKSAQTLDTILFYFSGHGILHPSTQQAFLCLADTEKNDIEKTGLPVQELLQIIGNSQAQHQVIWLDACHSGGMTLRGVNPTPQLVELLQNKAAKIKGFYALLSCDVDQQSWEFNELGHGVFTYYLIRGLQGEAADSQGVISADGLYRYVYHQTLLYIDKINQQLRLINQQKRGKGETQLFSEYPLQTPKRIVEGVGELILGKSCPIHDLNASRVALVVDGFINSQISVELSKILATTGGFDLQYLPRGEAINAQDIRTVIQEYLHLSKPSQETTKLLYLRGQLEENADGEAVFLLLENICLSCSWLRQQLRHCQANQQIIILDCLGNSASLQAWVEDLQLAAKKSQCIIAANSPQHNSELFTQALTATLKSASPSTGLSIAGWITQLQVYLAGNVDLQIWLSGTQGVIEIVPANTHNRHGTTGLDLKICPYRGLRAFQAEDYQYFYGRESLTQQLINELAKKSFLAVVGASGSGKSSVVQAGLIAQLRQGKQLPGSEYWWIKVLRPGVHPLTALSQRLTDKKDGENHLILEGILYQGVEGFVYWIRNRPEPMVVLVVDQFEELFTLASSEDKRRFLELLLGAVQYAPDRFKLVITLRADFISSSLEVPSLAQLLQKSSVLVPPHLNDDDYRRVIVNPAEQVGLKVEPGLVEVLLQELNHSAGDLPLLEFVLEQLWECREGGELTLKAYQQHVGGIKAALEKKAQGVYDNLDNLAQDCTRWIFLSLTQLGEGTEDTRRRVLKSDLVVKKYPQELVERTLQALTIAKLVVVSLEGEVLGTGKGEECTAISGSDLVTIEVAHEILIRHWSSLRWWLEENRIRLRSQRQIVQAATLWQNHGQQADFLLQGVRLAEAEEIYVKYTDELSSDVQDFIIACLEARQQQQLAQKKRLRQAQIAVVVISGLGIIASIFGGLAYWQKQAAQMREIAALNASSQAFLLSHQQLEAVIASIKAGRELKQVLAPAVDLKISTIATLQQSLNQSQEINRLSGHSQQINAVKFSPDGKIIASASDDQTVKLWTDQGKLIFTITGFNQRVKSIAFSPNGQLIAASTGNKIQLYHRNGKFIKTFTGHQDIVTEVNFSHDGKLLVSSSFDQSIKIWDINGRLVNSWNAANGWVNTVRFSPDDQIIVNGGEDNLVKIWRKDGKLIKILPGHQGHITKVGFSNDGKFIATASEDKTIKLWNSTGNLLQTLTGHTQQINSISFSPDNQTLASASADNTIKLWRIDGKLLSNINGNNQPIRDIAFSPNGKIIASVSDDKTVRLWQVKNHQYISGDIYSIAIYGHTFAAAGWDGKIYFNEKGKLTNFQAHQDIINAITFNHDGQLLASGSADKTIKIWQENKLIKTFTGHADRVTSLSFSPDNQILASGSADKTLKLWRLADGKLLKTLTGHSDEVTSINFSPDGQTIVSGSFDQTVKIWRRDGTLVKNFTGHGLAIASVIFSPNGQMIASASWDNTIKLWNPTTGKLIHTLTGHTDGVTSLSFTSDGQILASGSADQTIKVWNVTTGELLKTLSGYPHPITSLSFTADNKTLVVGGKEAGVMLWNFDLDSLLSKGCTTIASYLQNNPNLSSSDRSLCQN
jgi:WD40 repeat protein/uncharacterized caspase-like protein/energy-coupling factor transporter ATP-binding protein EcfA2